MPDYTTKSTAAVSVSAATAKSVLSVITGATRRVGIKRLTIGGLSVTSTDVPGTVEFVQFDTDGTGTAVTPTPLDPAETASISTSKANYTAEPTVNASVKSVFPLSPKGVTAEKVFDPPLMVPVSKILAVRCTFPQAQSIWPELEYSE